MKVDSPSFLRIASIILTCRTYLNTKKQLWTKVCFALHWN